MELNLLNQFNKNVLEISNCKTTKKAFRIITNKEFSHLFNENSSLSEIFLSINENLVFLNEENVETVSSKFNRSIVITFESKIDFSSFILWKKKEWNKMLVTEIKNENLIETESLAEVTQLIRKFIVKSVEGGLSGIVAELDVLSIKNNFINLAFLADQRGFNMLMLASEAGNIQAVNYFLKINFDENFMIHGETAANLAYKNKHYEIVLKLLKFGSVYPRNFSINNTYGELKNFVTDIINLHESIKRGNVKNVEKIVQKYPKLKHFFNSNNESAPLIALKYEQYDCYEVLLVHNVCFGRYEDVNSTLESMKPDKRQKLAAIHLKHTKFLAEPVILTLMANTSLSHDSIDENEKLNYIAKAFHLLFQQKFIKVILKLVAAARNFHLIFDFNRENVQFVDPTSVSYASGVFHLSGRIYIAALGYNDSDDPMRSLLVLGTIAHELCHFAMVLTYENDGNPYTKSDEKNKNAFEKISKKCQQMKGIHKIIDNVYGEKDGKQIYNLSNFHAELIVRVVQLIAIYGESGVKVYKEYFEDLFSYYEQICFPDMEKAISKVKKRALEEYQQNARRKISFLKKLSISVIILGILSVIATYSWFNNPSFLFDHLDSLNKAALKNSSVKYFEVDVKLYELLGEKDECYLLLKSKEIEQALNGNSKSIEETLKEPHMEQCMILSWQNLNSNLKTKALSSKVNFNGITIELKNISSANGTALQYFSTSEIIKLLKGNFTINSMREKLFLPFYVDRFLIRTNLSSYVYSFKIGKSIQNKKAKKLEELFEELKSNKIVILSDNAKSGKTATFLNATSVLRKTFKNFWVAYINLEDQETTLNHLNFKNLKNFIAKDILELSSIDEKIFEHTFDQNRSIFLWDGFDKVEIIKDKVLELFSYINKKTGNFQLISTRSHLKNDLLNLTESVLSYKFIPFATNVRYEFVEKLVITQNHNLSLVHEVCRKITKFCVSKDFPLDENSINTPFFLTKLTEIALKININEYKQCVYDGDIFNHHYKLFKCLEQKTNIDQAKLIGYGMFSQYIAMKLVTSYDHEYRYSSALAKYIEKRLNETETLDTTSLAKEEILVKNAHGSWEFNHKSFKEFYLAEYLIHEFFEADNLRPAHEVKLRIGLLISIMARPMMGLAQVFIEDYLKYDKKNESCVFASVTRNLLMNHFKDEIRSLDKYIIEKIANFFKCDHNLYTFINNLVPSAMVSLEHY